MTYRGLGRVSACACLAAALACGSDNNITAHAPGVSVIITPVVPLMRTGESVALSATVLDAQGNPVPGGPITWSSDVPRVALVSGGGVVTARLPGYAGIQAAAACCYGYVRLLIIDSLVRSRVEVSGNPFGIAVSGDRAFVTLPSVDSIAVLNVTGESWATTFPAADIPTLVDANPERTRIYVAEKGGRLAMLDAATHATLGSVPIPGTPYAPLASADGSRIWVAATDEHRVYAFNPTSLAVIDSTTALVPWAHRMIEHPSLSRLYVSGLRTFQGEQDVYELDSQTLDSLRSWSLGGTVQGMAISPDGATLYVVNQEGWIDAIPIASGGLQLRAPLPWGAFDVVLAPGGNRLAVTVSDVPKTGYDINRGVWFLDPSNLSVTSIVLTGGDPKVLAYSADGKRLLVANSAGWVDFIR